MLVVLPISAIAGQWQSESLTSFSTSYNDNPTLLPTELNPQSTASMTAFYESEFTYLTPASTFGIAPRVQGIYYLDRDLSDLDTINYFLTLDSTVRRALVNWGITAGLDQQNILSSEDTDPNDPDSGGDGNFLRADDTLTRYRVSPRVSWTPTPQDSLSLGLNYTVVDYDLDFTGRSDFETYAITLNYQRILSLRQSIGVTGGWLDSSADRLGLVLLCDGDLLPETGCTNFQLETADFLNDSDGYNANLLYSFNWTETLTVNASFGRQNTDVSSRVIAGGQESFAVDSNFKSDQYSLRLVSERERTEWNLGISRAVQPSSNGAPSDKIQFDAGIGYRITDRMRGSFAVVAFRQESVSDARITENEFLRADAGLSYSLNRQWSVNTTYSFRNNDPRLVNLQGEEADATQSLNRKSNSISISTRYSFR